MSLSERKSEAMLRARRNKDRFATLQESNILGKRSLARTPTAISTTPRASSSNHKNTAKKLQRTKNRKPPMDT